MLNLLGTIKHVYTFGNFRAVLLVLPRTLHWLKSIFWAIWKSLNGHHYLLWNCESVCWAEKMDTETTEVIYYDALKNGCKIVCWLIGEVNQYLDHRVTKW